MEKSDNKNLKSNNLYATDSKELNKLRLVFEQTPGAIFILDREFRFEYVNPGFTKLSGYSKDELIGNSVNELFYHENLPESRKEIVEKLLNGEKWQGELLTINKNGSTYWANTIAAPYKEESGEIDGYIIIQQDISDRKEMEISLQESEKLYRTLIESSLEAVSLNQDGKFLLVNDAFCELFGYTREEVFSMNPPDFIAPEDRERVMEIHYKRMRGEMNTMRYSANFLHKTGRKILTELNATTVQVNGRNASFISMCDITERTEMENALRDSEEKYKTLVENSHDGIMIVRNFRILYANDTLCNMLGYCLSDHQSDIIHPDDKHKLVEINERRKNGDISTIHETLRLITKTGETKECETTSTMIRYNDDWAAFYTIHDVTDRNRLEIELKKSERKYRELTEMLPLAVYELDVQGKPTYINQTGYKLFGLDKDAKPKKGAITFFKPDDQKLMQQRLEQEAVRMTAIEGKYVAVASPPEEYTAINSKGEEIPVLIYGAPIIEDGKAVGSRGVIVDISERKAMENALRENEEKYKTLIENSQDGIFAIEGEKILFANNTFCRMIGYTPVELYSKPASELVYSEDRAKGLSISERRKNGDYSKVNELFRFITKNGSIKEGDVFSSVIDLNHKKVSLITVHDLTEIRRFQEELIKSEQKYRELAEMLPQTVYELDLNANLRYLNKAGREKFGTAYETSDVSVFSIVIPEELERMKNNFNNVSFKKIPSKGNFYKLKQIDGQIFEAMISATPMLINGKTVGSRGVVIDISEHAAMQKALAESEEKYRSLIENALDGIIITQDGLIKFCNKAMADMLQVDEKDLTNISFLDKVIPDDHQRMIEFHKRRMNGEDFVSLYRSRLIRKNGKIITVELNARTSDYNGRPAAFIIVRDITKRIKIEDELQIAKNELEKLNSQLEKRVRESSKRLTEARTQLINLQKENLQSQYDVLKQQVNPHFLFNSLNVLTSLIKLEPDLAEKFSEQLSKVYRYVLENKDNELVDLNTELNFLDAYFFLLNIRFVGKLTVNLHIPDENRTDRIIPLAMQLLIENAIKHNVMSKQNPLKIDIFVDADGYLNVNNNLQERPSQIISTGVGLKNILNRYQLLNLTLPEFEKTEKEFKAKIKLIKST